MKKRRPQNLNVRDARKILGQCNVTSHDVDWHTIRSAARRIEKRSLKADARTGRDETDSRHTAGRGKK